MMLRSAIMLAAVAAATATSPGIRASVSSAGLQYIVVSGAFSPLNAAASALAACHDLPFSKPSIGTRAPLAPSSQGVAIPMIEKKFSTINIPDVSKHCSPSPGEAGRQRIAS